MWFMPSCLLQIACVYKLLCLSKYQVSVNKILLFFIVSVHSHPRCVILLRPVVLKFEALDSMIVHAS